VIRRFITHIPLLTICCATSVYALESKIEAPTSQETQTIAYAANPDSIATIEEAVSFDKAAALYKQNDFPAAFAAFSRLAAKGDARSQTILALMYKFGEGTQINTKKAFSLYQQAAKQGYAPAQFHTGKLYAEGLDTNPDLIKAEYWLKEAANQGFARAENTLAEVLESRHHSRSTLGYEDKSPKGSQSEADNPKRINTKGWDFRLPKSYSIENEQQAQTLPTSIQFNNPESIRKEKKYSAQLGAMASQSAANNLWMALREKNPQVFNNLEPQISNITNPKGLIYRLRTGHFSSYAEAQNFCTKLYQKDGYTGCLATEDR
jgi:cell division septation protein DedD